ncbi:uncharacterized protein J8A68_000802 [[Candida] subhashii]|uniref:Uncharacterized protein n=1 Tax=[Candida] subhashii TaxID=561895 RepID=A0A8J5URI5_9ASCO|nr:uncharacterized protein J8A68_000802 [[Candida] subhashii]KAG7665596.1 hypothetical protein J8A68_000802 [[Candida] subhashii]
MTSFVDRTIATATTSTPTATATTTTTIGKDAATTSSLSMTSSLSSSSSSVFAPQPIAPIPTKLNDNEALSKMENSITPSPTPRSTPFGVLIDDFNSKYLHEKHLVEDIVEKPKEQMPKPPLLGLNTGERGDTPTWLISSTFVDELKETLPLISHEHATTYAIITHYLSNELFYANSLMNITQSFLNHEFNSFGDNLILDPNIPKTAKPYHGDIIDQLSMIYDYIIELTSIIEMFNDILRANIDIDEVSFINLKTIKSKLEYLVMSYLCDGIHDVMDSITEGIYEYNLYIEQLRTSEEAKGEEVEVDYDEDDGSSYSLINGLYDKIENTLKLKTDKLTNKDVSKFYTLLTYGIIENEEWNDLIKKLKALI